MDVVNLGRRKTVKLKLWILRVQRSQQIFIPLDAEVGMQSALHEHASTAQRDGFVDLLADFFKRPDVSVRRAGSSVESTERANYIANVRVVDIAVDDVGDDVIGMSSLANFVCRHADPRDIMRLEQRGAIVSSQPHPRESFIQNTLYLTRHVCSLLLSSTISKMGC